MPALRRGDNDLQTVNPDLAKQWHPTKNGERTPSDIAGGSAKKVWWQCPLDARHEWQASPSSRMQGRGCPVCGGSVVIPGVNDLATLSPEIASMWHPTLNQASPTEVRVGSKQPYWWRCSTDSRHEWRASPLDLRKGQRCAVCAGMQVMAGVNDLATTHPHLAGEWHPTLNSLTPTQVTGGSSKKVWWQCARDTRHEWQAAPSSRARGRGCPVCSGSMVIPGVNDLSTLSPEIASLWHPLLNRTAPNEVSVGSKKLYWWRCSTDPRHQWKASPLNLRNGQGCAVCAGKAVMPGINDLATTHPNVASRWHPTLNDLSPTQVTAGSHRLVWFTCPDDDRHVTKARILMATSRPFGCAVCDGRQVMPGVNDLATLRPDIASEWHESKNASGPDSVTLGSHARPWWQCSANPEHEWRTNVYQRTLQGKGCPACARRGYDATKPGLFYFIRHREMSARKVGITNPIVTANRLKAFQKAGWEVVKTWSHEDGDIIRGLETAILKWLRKDQGLPPYLTAEVMPGPGGADETFAEDGVSDLDIIHFVDRWVRHYAGK